MGPDDNVCVCMKVSLRKLAAFLERERPEVASRLSECLGSGTGCGWCVPYLEELHRKMQAGEPLDLDDSPERYQELRKHYHQTGERPAR